MGWLILHSVIVLIFFPKSVSSQYEPNWDSLDQRPLPRWYDEAKFGIFVHWGLYSVPAYKSEWFWWYWKGDQPRRNFVDFMTTNYKPGFSYADFAPMFTTEFFNAYTWADIFAKSGAKYVVLTSKHHEGFTLWPSKYSWNWNSVDTGPHRDLVNELSQAVRKRNLTFGLYYSQFEWFNPLWQSDQAANFTTNTYPRLVQQAQLHELIEKYKPDVLWSDGDAGPDHYWNSTNFLAWLYNESPVRDTVVTNDRWGDNGVACKHGGFMTCQDRYDPAKLQSRKWENCMTLQRNSWGFDRTAQLDQYLSAREILQLLAETVSYGGNLLLNVGPTHDGRLIPIFEERLLEVGKFMNTNGEAIYGSNPWKVCQNDSITPLVWYTTKNTGTIYATFFQWPTDTFLKLGCPKLAHNSVIRMLGVDKKLKWKPNKSESGISIDLLPITFPDLPSNIGWTLKLDPKN